MNRREVKGALVRRSQLTDDTRESPADIENPSAQIKRKHLVVWFWVPTRRDASRAIQCDDIDASYAAYVREEAARVDDRHVQDDSFDMATDLGIPRRHQAGRSVDLGQVELRCPANRSEQASNEDRSTPNREGIHFCAGVGIPSGR